MIGYCDPCGKGPRRLARVFDHNGETYYCEECGGGQIDPEDQAEVEAEYAGLTRALGTEPQP